MKHRPTVVTGIVVVALAIIAVPRTSQAHCDTMKGPVVTAARAALEQGDLTPVLRWVKPDAEADVREAFRLARAARAAGPDAKSVADRFFFETVVRLHRQGEGEPYTGLKPAGSPIEPAIVAADRAVAAGSVDALVSQITTEVSTGLRTRFEHLKATGAHADHTVDAGRAHVAAYVDFLHTVERLHAALAGAPGHAGHVAAGAGTPGVGHAPHK